jgi:integrase
MVKYALLAGFWQKASGNAPLCQRRSYVHLNEPYTIGGSFMRNEKRKQGAAGNLLAQFEKLYRHNRQGSFKTKERYSEAMKRFCVFIAERFRLQKLTNIAPKHILAYVEDMKGRDLSASTIKTDLSTIRFWHDKLPDAKFILPVNDELDLESRSFGKMDRAWSVREYNYMVSLSWEHNREDYAAIFTLARYAGLRIHECFRIDTATAERAIKAGEITVKGKGGKVRAVPINESLKIELTAMLKITQRGHKLFVLDNVSTHSAIARLQQFIIDHREKVKDPDSERPMTFHGLRHLCAAEWYLSLKEKGYDEESARKQVSKWLGHKRDDVTRIYLASLPRLEGERNEK